MNDPRDDLIDRFRASMALNRERWHDGTGYELSLLQEATPGQRAAIENLLVSGGVRDWRDVEALAVLGTARAEQALRTALGSAAVSLRLTIVRHAPHLVDDAQYGAILVEALQTADLYGGLSQALDHLVDFHPPEAIAALWRGVEERDGEVAVHFAAMLCYLHGIAAEPFEQALRDLFLRFGTDDPDERAAALADLRGRIAQAG